MSLVQTFTNTKLQLYILPNKHHLCCHDLNTILSLLFEQCINSFLYLIMCIISTTQRQVVPQHVMRYTNTSTPQIPGTRYEVVAPTLWSNYYILSTPVSDFWKTNLTMTTPTDCSSAEVTNQNNKSLSFVIISIMRHCGWKLHLQWHSVAHTVVPGNNYALRIRNYVFVV
jgi:hypothetical protein